MRAARLVLVGLVILLVAAACGSGGLTEAERVWCGQNEDAVWDVLDVLAPDVQGSELWPAVQRVMDEQGFDAAERFLRESPEWEQACRAAFEGR